MSWIRTDQLMPRKDEKVTWMSPNDGSEIHGTYCGVWMMGNGMYVYYLPKFWKSREKSWSTNNGSN